MTNSQFNFTEGCKTVAQRQNVAYVKFVETIMNVSGCSKVNAEKVFSVYKKERIIKLDSVGGVWNVKHGVFMEVDVINNAIVA